jgi:uncharacterized membrane protein YedE/YeeE
MSDSAHLATQVAWCSFGLAFIFGAVANRTNFCTMGAISDAVNMGDWGRMRMWLLAIATAIAGTSALHYLGLIDLSKSFFPRPNMTWLSYLIGGFLFGMGMTLGSGCGSKSLIRLGGGNLKSLVVLVFLGISAYMTLKGVFAVWRRSYLDSIAFDFASRGVGGQDLPTLLTAITGIEPQMTLLSVAALITIALLVFIFKDRDFRHNGEQVFGGLVVGALIVAGWYVTGHIGYGENPETLETVFFGTNSKTAESFSFVAPVAYTLELLMLWTDKSLIVTFGVAAVAGAVAGSATYALWSKSFHWEGFVSIADTRNHIIAGALMGFGGVTALGCSIGQGISGVSTLALGSFVALFAMIAGAALTMKYQYWRLMHEA